jgi:hypothetical protein
MSSVQDQKDQNENEQQVRNLLLLTKAPEMASAGFDLAAITKLDLFQAGLSSLPTSLSTLLPNLSILFCMKNEFQEVPEVIGQCQTLQMVSFKSNQIKTIHPEALQPQLRWLILTDNQITHLPTTIGRCVKLQKCMLSGNRLERLPTEIAHCHNLELIRLASNQLAEPPIELLNLPNLIWVAFSDNPFLKNAFQNHETVIGDGAGLHLDVFADECLDDPSLGVELGKGASGITRRYHTLLPNQTEEQPVAVKEYFSTITSDGNPQEERKVSMVASSLQCKSLVKVLGSTKNGNLIMGLLQNYIVFAGPPSLESCSRDVYDENRVCSETRATAMVEELLHALMKLHEHGICHGDFYGHNILISKEKESEVWLTDFGAAFFYEPEAAYGKLIQQVERRAFQHLLHEIAALMPSSSSRKEKISQLASCCENMTFGELYLKWTELKG